MALSDAERQRRRRHRRREERQAAARRAEVRAILEHPVPTCACCGEREIAFLVLADDEVLCRNCAGVRELGGLCPHRGISRRLR